MTLRDDLVKLPQETLAEVQRQAELYLAAQLQAGIAADSRAISFVSLMAAATVAVGGGGVALLIANHPSVRLGITAVVMAISFVASMACAIISARPVDFEYSGGRPEDWQEDAQIGKVYVRSQSELLEQYNDRAGKNNNRLSKNASWMQSALWIAFGTLVFGTGLTIAFLIARRH